MKQDNRKIASDLLESTVKVIARDGFDKASTRNIAGECGIADAYIYVHFKDKDDLFSKAFQKEDAALAREVKKYLPILSQQGITNEDRLYFLFSQTWMHLVAYPDSCRSFGVSDFPVFRIYGSSMSPTVNEGEIVVSLKGSRFECGDVVVLSYNNKLLVKRMIAGSGQWFDMD